MKKIIRKLLHLLRIRGLSVALICLFLAALVGLNTLFTTLEKKNAWRVDYSFNALTSYGNATAEVLEGLEHPVHIYALYARGQEDQPLLELLDRYAAASPLVTWEQADISLNPALLTRFRGSTSDESLTNDSLIVYCEETERFKVLTASDFLTLSYDYAAGAYQYAGLTYESSLTSAIVYVTQGRVPRVMILQGHGELDEDGTALFASLLDANHYDVYYFTLNTTETSLVPGDDLLVILSPVRDFTDEELAKITTFIDGGGSVLFTCDFTDPVQKMPNYQALLRSYGFLPLDGVVVASSDESSSYYNNSRIQLIPRMQSTTITQSMVSAGDTFLIMPSSRGFEMPSESDRYLLTEAILTSTDKSYVRNVSSGSVLSLSQQADDPSGPFALALSASRITESGSVSNAVILGSSALLTSDAEYAMTVTEEFIIRTARYLLGEDTTDVGILARTAVRPALTAPSTMLGSIIIVALPMLVLGLAAFMLVWRRHK